MAAPRENDCQIIELNVDDFIKMKGRIVGYTHYCKFTFKDGRSAEGRSFVSDDESDAPKKALCEAWAAAYGSCIAQGISYMRRTGACTYYLEGPLTHEFSGPNAVREPGHGDD